MAACQGMICSARRSENIQVLLTSLISLGKLQRSLFINHNYSSSAASENAPNLIADFPTLANFVQTPVHLYQQTFCMLQGEQKVTTSYLSI